MISHRPAPFNIKPAPINDEFIKGLLCSRLCGLPCGELDESTLLPLNDGDGTNLPKLVEVIPFVGKKNGIFNQEMTQKRKTR